MELQIIVFRLQHSVLWLFYPFQQQPLHIFLYYRGLRQAGSANLSLVTLLVPPMAVIWGALVLGERLHSSAYIGFVLIALGMTIIDGRLLKREKR
ncbi:MAG: EamA family transporter [Amylibacter sp.]|nr:EamA family transporter [Amylibacter sp.]